MVRRGGIACFRRIVVEPMEDDPVTAREHAIAIESVLTRAGIRLEQAHHGMGRATGPVLRQAISRGHGIRIGFEDVTVLPDGTAADDNLALVLAAAELLESRRSEYS